MDAAVLDTLNLAAAVVGAGIAGMALARLRESSTRRPLFAFVAAGIAWAVGDLVAEGATDPATKQLGVTILYTGSIAVPPLWWIVALRWSDEVGARLPLRNPAWQWAPLAWACAMWLAMITNPLHGEFITPVVGGRNVYHALWYWMALPSYALILSALAVEIAVAQRVRQREVRHQAAFLIAASAVTLVGNWLYVTGLVPVNLTVLVLSASVSLLVVGMAREGLFGVLPAALQALAAEHPEGVVVVGEGGHVDYANERAEALLAPVALRRDRPVLETLRDPRLRPQTALGEEDAEWWDALAGRTGLLFLLGSERRWIQATARTVSRGRSGEGRLLQLADVTQRHQIEQHRIQQRRLDSVASLARNVAHDFQSAFAVVRANAELLDEADERPRSRHLTRILDAAEVGSNLAYELQMHAGLQYSTRVTLDLAELVDEACVLAESDLAPGTALSHRRSDELLPVEADPLQLRDALFALLGNAVEATVERGGCIEVATGIQRVDPRRQPDLVWGQDEASGAYAFVRVTDDGGGMDPDTAERAFEPFFSTRAKDRGGGLSAVLGIARAHEALVGLENDPGWGCTFALYLPLATSAAGA